MPVTNNIQAGSAIGGLSAVADASSTLSKRSAKLLDDGFNNDAFRFCIDKKIVLDGRQINVIDKAIRHGDMNSQQIINLMLDPVLPADKMLEVRNCVRAGVNLDGYRLDQMTPQQIHEEFASKVIPEGVFHANSLMSRENTIMFEVFPFDNDKENLLGCVVLDSTRQQPIPDAHLVEWSKPVSPDIIISVKSELDKMGYLSRNLEKCIDGCDLYNTVKKLVREDSKVCECLDNSGVMGIEYSLNGNAYTMPMPRLTKNFKNSPDVLSADHFLLRDKTQVIESAMKFAHEFGESNMCVNLVTYENPKMHDFLSLEQKTGNPITSIACDNELWINVSRCNDLDVTGIYLKEVGVKMGFENLVGKDVAGEFLNTVWDNAQNNWAQSQHTVKNDKNEDVVIDDMPVVKSIVNDINTRFPNYTQEEKGLEFIKSFAQTAQVKDQLNKQEKGIWVTIKNAVKKLLKRRFKVDVSQAMSETTLTRVIVESCKVGLEMRGKTKLNLVVSENQKQQLNQAHIQLNKQEKKQKKGLKV